jgi:hypothetical protein
MHIIKKMTKRTRVLEQQKNMKAMKVLLRKYNLEEDAVKLGYRVEDIQDLACVDQKTVDSLNLKGTVAQYMDIFNQETDKEAEDVRNPSKYKRAKKAA